MFKLSKKLLGMMSLVHLMSFGYDYACVTIVLVDSDFLIFLIFFVCLIVVIY